ncbi:membrane protein [Rhizocola hellebori]|uniref:Membrane protein n=1 Tax=Rhizocola hellebori TaxID=1392758 RepID=A0A8J3QB18_9ACTN|nr:PH domain-containing protein [Rhizocola hellebori]GIH07261.1 membrane protein [Rhizocola hellebori]
MTQENGHALITRQRLHPLSPVLKGLRLFVLAVVAMSWRSLQQLHFWTWLAVVAGLFVILLIYSTIAWRFTGYEVIGRELRIYEGLISRRVRTVPLERLQAIEVMQPFQAKPFGLAELKLDVAGAQRSEAPLAFLPMPEALALRSQLLALSGGHSTAVVEEETEHELRRVDNNAVVFSQLLTPPVMFTPIAVLYIASQLVFNEDRGFFTIAAMISAFVATIGAPVMRTLNFWDFRLARSADGKLRIRHGLLNSRSQVVPVHRIQSLTLTWPLLWRAKAWLRVTLAVAGQTSVASEGGKAETDRLLPVATLEEARAVMPYVMPGVDPANLPMTPVPRRVRWLAPLRARVLAAGLHDEVFGAVDGFATRTLTIVPYGRIQSVRLTQGPWQRRLGVATVHADVAGSTPVSAAHRPVEEARAWARDLAARSHAARAAALTPPTTGGH